MHAEALPPRGISANLGGWVVVIPAKAGIQWESVNKQPAVHILASKRNSTPHIGVSSIW